MDTTTARTVSSRLADLLRREHAVMADFLVALADFDRRRLWVALGHSSLWYYLHRELGLSKGAAFHRKVAAELLQRFPAVEAPLRDGRLCLSSVVELGRVLAPETESWVLPRFFHRSAREAKEVAAELAPRAVVPARVVVRQLPELRPAELVQTSELALREAPTSTSTPTATSTSTATSTATATATATPTPTPTPAATTDPLTADRSRLHVTVSRRFLDKLAAARDALAHSHPSADAEAVLEAGLDLLLARAAKRRGLVEKPRAPHARPTEVPTADTIPAHVRRAVWTRDGGRCQWELAGGGLCGATHRLELDHVRPRALGGPSTIENLRILCRFHNDLAAREAFGDDWVNRCSARPRSSA